MGSGSAGAGTTDGIAIGSSATNDATGRAATRMTAASTADTTAVITQLQMTPARGARCAMGRGGAGTAPGSDSLR